MRISVLIPTALILLFSAVYDLPAADRPIVSITADLSGPTTRVVLTHDRHVVFAVTEFENRLEVVYAEKINAQPSARDLEDPILQGWTVRGDNTLVLRTGDGFTGYDSFELRNPSRLVLDLQGNRASGRRTAPTTPRDRAGRTVIVLDPGHGGMQAGAIGHAGLKEKDVALELAFGLKTALQKDPSVSVVLTRDEDRHLELDERTAIANHNRADLFISIHLNASRRETAFGAETYFLSAEATDDEARILAGLENDIPGVHRENLPSTPETRSRGLDMILWDMAQNQYLAESSALAEAVQREMNRLTGTRDRGVRQAPFRVLMGATMPAILVEVGFITNPEEERLFNQPPYRARVVEALARAVREFQRSLKTFADPGDEPAGGGR